MIPAVIIEPQPRWVSFTPYWRNDRILKKEFGVPILKDYSEFYHEKIRNLIITYWSGWADYLEIGEFIKRHREAQIFRMLNEYGVQSLSSHIMKLIDETQVTLIANFPRTKKKAKEYINLNLNTLIYEEEIHHTPTPKKYDLIYYGMFRPNRADYFKKYLDGETFVSTSPKNILLFKQIGVRPRFIDTFLWGSRSILDSFRFSLYIEDIYTHTHYNYPANRFYEALMYNTVLLFDSNCANTFKTAGYPVEDYFVSNLPELKKKMEEIKKDYPAHLKIQAKWRKRSGEERREVLDRLRPIFT